MIVGSGYLPIIFTGLGIYPTEESGSQIINDLLHPVDGNVKCKTDCDSN